MIQLAWVLSLIFAFGLGFAFERIRFWIVELRAVVMSKVDKKVVTPAPPSSFIDFDDPMTAAKFEFEERMKDLNPKNE